MANITITVYVTQHECKFNYYEPLHLTYNECLPYKFYLAGLTSVNTKSYITVIDTKLEKNTFD